MPLLIPLPAGSLLFSENDKQTLETIRWITNKVGCTPSASSMVNLSVEHINVSAESGNVVPVVLFIPRNLLEPKSIVLWFHPGGFVTGRSSDHTAVKLARETGVIVASVDYRLAPEHRFPAAVTDGIAALRWFAVHAADYGVSSEQIGVAGESAGGNIAAAIAHAARDYKIPLKFQFLIVPMLRFGSQTESAVKFSNIASMPARNLLWFWLRYAPRPEDSSNPLCAPFLGNMKGLAPAVIVTASHDVLRDDGRQYVEKLRAVGVPVSHFEGFSTHLITVGWNEDVVAQAFAAMRKTLAS